MEQVIIVGANPGVPFAAAAAAREWLCWTEGQHIGPDRNDVIAELLRIADEELPFRTAN